MTDRELLELAAKAAGIEIARSRLDDPMQQDMLINAPAGAPQNLIGWNPLTDDGDAFRLAVKLNIDISKAQDDLHNEIGDESYHIDRYAATRRAIVRAAAEIGKAMP